MNDWIRSLLMPVQGTAHAARVDQLWMFLVWFTAFFFFLIAGLLGWFVFRYRRRSESDRTPHITHNNALEAAWTLIPLGLVMFIFFWGFHTYMDAAVTPGDALEIHVTARKWVWQFEYPNGTRTINELHVPLDKPVELVMTSQDVIHSFFVPSFRVKQDVVPEVYTRLSFTPSLAGLHRLECAEYCGKGHSEMLGKIFVDDPAKFDDWLATGGDEGKNMPLAQLGRMVYETRGCKTCHSLDGTRGDGPSFKGVFGHPVPLSTGQMVMADENYLRESIMYPQAKIVAGFGPIMPTFQGMLREREIQALIEFIKEQQ